MLELINNNSKNKDKKKIIKVEQATFSDDRDLVSGLSALCETTEGLTLKCQGNTRELRDRFLKDPFLLTENERATYKTLVSMGVYED